MRVEKETTTRLLLVLLSLVVMTAVIRGCALVPEASTAAVSGSSGREGGEEALGSLGARQGERQPSERPGRLEAARPLEARRPPAGTSPSATTAAPTASDGAALQGGPRGPDTRGAPGDEASAEAAPAAYPELPAPADHAVPAPFELSVEACFALLGQRGVPHRRIGAESPEAPLLALLGPIDGIEVHFVGRRRVHAEMDCRVAVAILAWAPDLRAFGVRRLRHMSIHRPRAVVATTGNPSGHAGGLAMDLRFLDFTDGRTVDVLEDWGGRVRGEPPCDLESHADDPAQELRRLVCSAVERDLFQTVITPHRDDAHQNHVHVEVVPDATWRFVH